MNSRVPFFTLTDGEPNEISNDFIRTPFFIVYPVKAEWQNGIAYIPA